MTATDIAAPATTRPSLLGAVGIGVSDLAKSTDFYTRVLGMKVITTFKLDYMDEVVVGYGDRQAALVLMHWTDGSPRNYRDNPIKIVLYVDSPQAVIDAVRTEGLEIVREPAPFGEALIAFAKDPDGYLVELIQRAAR